MPTHTGIVTNNRVILLTACSALLLGPVLIAPVRADDGKPIDIGSRRELFVDDYLIASMKGARQLLHHPTPREIVMTFDKPWEGNISACWTVIQEPDKYRLYYRAQNFNPKGKKYGPERTAYAESTDGIHWTRPNLGLFEINGSKANNVIWQDVESHNFTPFKDDNPNCAPDARYKAFGGGNHKVGIRILKSADGIHWQRIQPGPAITDGVFDSQNTAMWWAEKGCYLAFFRTWTGGGYKGFRDISTATSKDFVHWSKTTALDYGDAPTQHLYTNGIKPYFRAPHILLGFPKRFFPERKHSAHVFGGISECTFMSSRDGIHWHRRLDTFIRPGLMPERWVNRNNMPTYGLVTTKADLPGAPDVLTIYTSEGYYVGPCRIRRFTLRQDGFVSLHAGLEGGEVVTKPLVFAGKRLTLNMATSAAGGVRVEIQDEAGKPLAGFGLDDCDVVFGDELERIVTWKGSSDVGKLAGKPVRLRFVLRDADVYALRFVE